MSLKFIANSANQVSCHWLKADIMSAVYDFYVNSGTFSVAVAGFSLQFLVSFGKFIT
jgi:hypothetical protein